MATYRWNGTGWMGGDVSVDINTPLDMPVSTFGWELAFDDTGQWLAIGDPEAREAGPGVSQTVTPPPAPRRRARSISISATTTRARGPCAKSSSRRGPAFGTRLASRSRSVPAAARSPWARPAKTATPPASMEIATTRTPRTPARPICIEAVRGTVGITHGSHAIQASASRWHSFCSPRTRHTPSNRPHRR